MKNMQKGLFFALFCMFLFCAGCGNRLRPAGLPSKPPTAVVEKDGSWGAEVGVMTGVGAYALMWALLSESQDALLTQTINQVRCSNSGTSVPQRSFAQIIKLRE